MVPGYDKAYHHIIYSWYLIMGTWYVGNIPVLNYLTASFDVLQEPCLDTNDNASLVMMTHLYVIDGPFLCDPA